MSDFKTRLSEEYNELTSKIGSLERFLEGPVNLSFKAVALLKHQLDIMKAYASILDERVDLIKKEEGASKLKA